MKKFISLMLFVMLTACMSNSTMSPQRSTEAAENVISSEKPLGASDSVVDTDTVNASYNINASYNVDPSTINQTIYSRKCCDVYNNVRCYLDNWTPVGDPCFCYYQGWGHSC